MSPMEAKPVSIADFVRDPLVYSRSHVVQFSHGAFPPAQAAMQLAATTNNWGGAWHAEEYQQMPGQYTHFTFMEAGVLFDGSTANLRVGTGDTANHSIKPVSGANDLGIRYLPWKADACTYMSLDPAARTFFTGPLSGCSIFLGTDTHGTWWAFHANRNNQPGHDNAALKNSMVFRTIDTLPAGVTLYHEARYKRDYRYLGFVFGMIRKGEWKFYAVDTKLLAPTGDQQYHFTTTVQRI
jgi:hypothetical protein